MVSSRNFATVTFADDLRFEQNGKKMLNGIYAQDILFQKLPQSLPSMWVCVKYGTPIDEADLPTSLEIDIPGAPKPIRVPLAFPPIPKNLKLDEDATVLQLPIDYSIPNPTFTKTGKIKVYVHTESGAKVSAGRLRVVDASEQSPDSELSINLPLHVLPTLIINFAALKKKFNDSLANEFATEAFMLLSGYLGDRNPLEMQELIGEKTPIDGDLAVVIFKEPTNDVPKIELISNFDDASAELLPPTKFGFGVKWNKPVPNPTNFEYKIIE